MKNIRFSLQAKFLLSITLIIIPTLGVIFTWAGIQSEKQATEQALNQAQTGPKESDIALARLQVEQANLSLEQAEFGLEQARNAVKDALCKSCINFNTLYAPDHLLKSYKLLILSPASVAMLDMISNYLHHIAV